MSTTAEELLEGLRLVHGALRAGAGDYLRGAGDLEVRGKLRHMVELDVREAGAPSGLGALIPLEELEAAAPALAEGFAAALAQGLKTVEELHEEHHGPDLGERLTAAVDEIATSEPEDWSAELEDERREARERQDFD